MVFKKYFSKFTVMVIILFALGMVTFLLSEKYSAEKNNSLELSKALSSENLPLVTLQSTELPNPPFLVDWCQGEDCEELTTRSVVCDANMHQQADLNSEIVGKIAAGEVLKDRTMFTKILKLGSYAVDTNHQAQVLTYAGAGVWATFFQKKFTAMEWDNEEARRKVKFDLPRNEGWILVKNQSDRTGFVQTFDGQDRTPCPLLVAPHEIQTTDREE